MDYMCTAYPIWDDGSWVARHDHDGKQAYLNTRGNVAAKPVRFDSIDAVDAAIRKHRRQPEPEPEPILEEPA